MADRRGQPPAILTSCGPFVGVLATPMMLEECPDHDSFRRFTAFSRGTRVQVCVVPVGSHVNQDATEEVAEMIEDFMDEGLGEY